MPFLTMLSAKKIGTYILEIGIASHSVLIGLALGVATKAEFIPLLLALCFHQFFEGIALGARIGEITHNEKTWFRASILALIFALTTPFGTALGIGIRASYQAKSYASLITQGILDGLSAGVLIYNALVNLITEEVTNGEEMQKASRGKKMLIFFSMWFGATAMAVVGKWA